MFFHLKVWIVKVTAPEQGISLNESSYNDGDKTGLELEYKENWN